MESPALHFFECYSNEVPGLVHEAEPPKMEPLDHETLVDSDEAELRLELLDGNVKQYGTVCRTGSYGGTGQKLIRLFLGSVGGTAGSIIQGRQLSLWISKTITR